MGKGARRHLKVLPLLPESRVQPWEGGGSRREDWLAPLRGATRARVASDERADAYLEAEGELDIAVADKLVEERDLAERLYRAVSKGDPDAVKLALQLPD